jgi:hypothetical protein
VAKVVWPHSLKGRPLGCGREDSLPPVALVGVFPRPALRGRKHEVLRTGTALGHSRNQDATPGAERGTSFRPLLRRPRSLAAQSDRTGRPAGALGGAAGALLALSWRPNGAQGWSRAPWIGSFLAWGAKGTTPSSRRSLVRTIQLAVGRAPVDRPADVSLETADGPVALLIPRWDPSSALPPSTLLAAASALRHPRGGAAPGGRDGPAPAPRRKIVTKGG